MDNMHQLSEKEKRTRTLAHKAINDDLPTRLKEYHHLLDTLMYLNDALSREKVATKDWEKFSDTLLMKFYYHGLSLHKIWSGQPISSSYFANINHISYFDIPSAKAVLRSKLETFLMYHYIYVNPLEEGTRELRYYSWIYTALLQRQEFPSSTHYAQRQKEKDAIEIERLKSVIVQLPAYLQLTAKQQKVLVEKGNAKTFTHWNNILQETGFTGSNTFIMLYTMLSIYSHSEGLSVIQLNAAFKDPTYQLVQARGDCHHAMQLTCLVISSLANKFPAVQSRLEKLPEELRYDIEILSRLAKANAENLKRHNGEESGL